MLYEDRTNFGTLPLDYSTQTIDDLVKIKEFLFRQNECCYRGVKLTGADLLGLDSVSESKYVLVRA
jgi:hypothetical protein